MTSLLSSDCFSFMFFYVQEELKRTKNVLDDAEKARSQEVLRRQEASAQIVRLTELKATLQQELENMGGGTVAEKQVRSFYNTVKNGCKI